MPDYMLSCEAFIAKLGLFLHIAQSHG